MSSPLAILGLSEGASRDEIRKAYHDLALKYHPDKLKSGSTDEMKTINKAYEDALQVLKSKAIHTSYPAPKPSCSGFKTPGSSYTTSHTTKKSGFGKYDGYESSYGTKSGTKSDTRSDTKPDTKFNHGGYGTSRAQDDFGFVERRDKSDLPEWVHCKEETKRLRVEEAEQELEELMEGMKSSECEFSFTLPGNKVENLKRKVESARSGLRRHSKWVEDGLEEGFDFSKFFIQLVWRLKLWTWLRERELT